MQRENQQLRKTIEELKHSSQRIIELEAENEQLQKAVVDGKTAVYSLTEVGRSSFVWNVEWKARGTHRCVGQTLSERDRVMIQTPDPMISILIKKGVSMKQQVLNKTWLLRRLVIETQKFGCIKCFDHRKETRKPTFRTLARCCGRLSWSGSATVNIVSTCPNFLPV